MYDELVNELRNMFRAYKATDNGNCRHAKTILQAADAIEGMNRRIDRAIELYNRNVEKSAMYEALAGINPEPLPEPPKEGE